jgi:ankyrin repeat protein
MAKLLNHTGNVNVNMSYTGFAGTPLMAACMPDTATFKDKESCFANMERIVHDLVAHGADVDAVAGPTIYNALCAASLCAGVGTINYLLDKSTSVRRADPLGRLPIHFAAANCSRVFEAVALVHGDNIMAHDMFGKNALHWAAQFGNVETVRTILSRLSTNDIKAYINSGDVDGWTPLAWAARPTTDNSYWMTLEPPHYADTIQCLIDHGADVSVEFRIVQGVTAEVLTALEMAKRCEAEEDVLRLLGFKKETEENRLQDREDGLLDSTKNRIYTKRTGICDVCLSVSLFSC